MKQYTFRQLQTSTKWLDELPIQVLRYGKVVLTLYGEENSIVEQLQRQIELLQQNVKELESRASQSKPMVERKVISEDYL